jgi:Superinfection immunity protein
MQALANSAAFWVLLILVLCAAYLLPTIIGMIRRVDRLALVFLVNLIGGTTGVGWLAALILAFGPRRISPLPPPVCGRPMHGPTVPWSPEERAGARGVIVMRAVAGQPDHFGSGKAGGRDSRSRQPVSG